MMNWHSGGLLTAMNFCKTWFAWGHRAALATWVVSSAATARRITSAVCAASSASCTNRQPDGSCESHQTRPTTCATALGEPGRCCGEDRPDEGPLSSDSGAAWVSASCPKEPMEEHVVCCHELARQTLDLIDSSPSSAVEQSGAGRATLASMLAGCSRSSGGKYMAQPFIAGCGPRRVSSARHAKARRWPWSSATAASSSTGGGAARATPCRFAVDANAIARGGGQVSRLSRSELH
mmetsp:Transcript_106427/g.307968  ORF Transcript_106427/g.307968 Transcript_106427/m.307968 type:complete len:236 (-) Transcript_106427:52-759(-)